VYLTNACNVSYQMFQIPYSSSMQFSTDHSRAAPAHFVR